MIKTPTRRHFLRFLMEKHTQEKVYIYYNHTDACNYFRWTSRECYQFMYARPWQEVVDFYENLVNCRTSLSALFGTEMHTVNDGAETVVASEMVSLPSEDRSGRWARVTFKIVLSYHGASFDGWQKQPGLNTVQGLVEKSLGRFVDERKVQLLKGKDLPIEGCAVVAGRTDKGVTAFEQVCSFYTWRKDVKPQDIEDSINDEAPGKLRVRYVAKVPREFHPNFSAKWRRYLYIFPLNYGEVGEKSTAEEDGVDNKYSDLSYGNQQYESVGLFDEGSYEHFPDNDAGKLENQKKPMNFRVSKVNQLLRQLEGKLLSYKMFARDTKASRNVGPPTECLVYHARATEVILPSSTKNGTGTKAMCVELVANRFLRKMVRVLVATAIREAAAGAEEDALLKLMDATCRRATAPPSPPDGLCLVNVGYAVFDPQNCLIS